MHAGPDRDRKSLFTDAVYSRDISDLDVHRRSSEEAEKVFLLSVRTVLRHSGFAVLRMDQLLLDRVISIDK